MEIAVQAIAGELVIETDAVVTQGAGAGSGQFIVDGPEEICLANSLFLRLLRRDAGNQTGTGLGQHIVSRPGVNHERLADWIEIQIGSQTGELHSPVPARIRAPGFVIMPVEAGCHFTVSPCCRENMISTIQEEIVPDTQKPPHPKRCGGPEKRRQETIS
jgi:hypothetical protein